MEIFAYYDCSPSAPKNQPDMVVHWERNWRQRGYKPRLITARHARRSKFYARRKDRPGALPLLAMHAIGGGLFAPFESVEATKVTKASLSRFFNSRARKFRP
jgi:hypothetical protein